MVNHGLYIYFVNKKFIKNLNEEEFNFNGFLSKPNFLGN